MSDFLSPRVEVTVSLDNYIQIIYTEYFFFIMMMIRDWNRLPREVTDIPSLAVFKVRSRIGL